MVEVVGARESGARTCAVVHKRELMYKTDVNKTRGGANRSVQWSQFSLPPNAIIAQRVAQAPNIIIINENGGGCAITSCRCRGNIELNTTY